MSMAMTYEHMAIFSELSSLLQCQYGLTTKSKNYLHWLTRTLSS